MQNVSASFTVGQNEPITSEYDIQQNEPIRTSFEINTAYKVVGEGVIDTSYTGNVITITSKTFVYEQAIASDVWIVQHNLHKQPSVFAVDTAGKVQLPDDIIYDNENQITIVFLAAFAGKAYLN